MRNRLFNILTALFLALFAQTASADPIVPSSDPSAIQSTATATDASVWEAPCAIFQTDLSRNRYYDPAIGRFLSRDPLGLINGPALYAGFLGDPINNVDPMGTDAWDWAWGFGKGVVNIVAEPIRAIHDVGAGVVGAVSGTPIEDVTFWSGGAQAVQAGRRQGESRAGSTFGVLGETAANMGTVGIYGEIKTYNAVVDGKMTVTQADEAMGQAAGGATVAVVAGAAARAKANAAPKTAPAADAPAQPAPDAPAPDAPAATNSALQDGPGHGPQGYGHLEDPSSVGPGKDFTAAQKANIYKDNMARNNGVLRDDVTGEILKAPQKSVKGVTPPENEATIDHVTPKNPADPNVEPGTNSYNNAQVRARAANRAKSNDVPTGQGEFGN